MDFNIKLTNVFGDNSEKEVCYRKDESEWNCLNPGDFADITLEPEEYLEIYAKYSESQIGCAIQFKKTSILFSNLTLQHTPATELVTEWKITNSSSGGDESGDGDINISIGDDDQ